MSPEDFRDDCWYLALTLRERWELLKDQPVAPGSAPGPAPESGSGSRDQEPEILERWRSQAPFAEGDHFHQRLARDGMTESELSRVLQATAAELRQLSPQAPPWLDTLEQAFLDPATLPFADLEPSRSVETSPFLSLILPLLAAGYRRLQESCSHLPEDLPWVEEKVLRTLHSHLSGRLSMFVRRPMVLELQIASLEESLRGETSEERFQSFIEQLEDRNKALEILKRYPVLTRKIVECVDQWLRFATEFLERYAEDWKLLASTFCDAGQNSLSTSLGRLEEARPGSGDSHRDGRSVCMLTFSSGLELVYKPRSLGGEKAFNDLLAWANERGFEPPFRVLQVLDRGDYGWEEFVAPAGCSSREELQRFYLRQGAYLAALYLLSANDMHFENVIAAGEHPIFIDLETLFHPTMDQLEKPDPLVAPGNEIYRTVHNVGLLPQQIWGTEGQEEGIDLSGLASSEGQLTAQRFLNLEGAGTDQMRLIRKQVEIPKMDHSPRLDEAVVSVADFTDDLVEGFSRCYRLLMEHRRELAAPHGPLTAFETIETRLIPRPTVFYNEILGESLHPDVLQDAVERDLLFDGLWTEVPWRPHLARLIPLEQGEMQGMDIPLFITRPDSLDLWNGAGERIPGFWSATAMSRCRAKLEALGESDLKRQTWLIKTSLDTLPGLDEPVRRPTYSFPPLAAPASREELLAAATAAGERLEVLAFRGPGDDVTWPIVTPVGKRHWDYRPAEPGLYLGLAGIALFLAHLGEALQEDRFTHLARRAWTTLERQLSSHRIRLPGVGAFTGWGGILYTAVHLAGLWNDAGLLDRADSLLEDFPQRIAEDDHHDLVGGAAGLILSLLSLHQVRPSKRILEVAELCGESLHRHAQKMEVGCGWRLEAAGSKPLGGLSHGAGGIAWALLELTALTGDERHRDLAREALAYERTLFSPTEQNWVDLREGERPEGVLRDSGDAFVMAWCHGAPGIGLARLAGLRHLDDSEIRQEIAIALQATFAQGFGSNHSLCHGDLGNLELPLVASQVLGDSALHERTYRLAGAVLKGIQENGWLYGYPAKVEPLGLMVGLAGIGYQLLRLAEPSRRPSVLLLERPTLKAEERMS